MKILIIASSGTSLINFRGDLIREILKKNHYVVAVAPEIEAKEKVNSLGAVYYAVPFARAGTSFFMDIKLVIDLVRIIREVKPDITFGYTIKPVVYGTIASKISGVRYRYSMITGLGSMFIGKRISIVKIISKILYKVSLMLNHKIFFQNPDDLNDFIKQKLVNKEKTVVVNGSGVNLSYYRLTPLPNELSFLMIARIIRDKGVIEFLEACREIKEIYPNVRCFLLGGYDRNPTVLDKDLLDQYCKNGYIEYFGKVSDVRPYITKCSVFVLPSYREGTPRSVLEAMSMGRPIITTDVPGCRETVKDGINGFLVPVKDTKSLFMKMEWFISNKDKISSMGKASYEYCLEKFDVRKVNEQIIKNLEL